MNIKIDHGVPIPKRIREGFSESVSKLKVGDSFVVKDSTHNNCMYQAARKHKIKLTIRIEGDHFRVWRVE